MNRDIYERLQRIKPQLEEQYKLSRLRLFGSHAREDYTEDSDVDIIIDFSETQTYFKIFGMIREMEKTLGKKVDFVFEDKIYPPLKRSIMEDAVDV